MGSLRGFNCKGGSAENQKSKSRKREQSSASGCFASLRGRYVHDFLWERSRAANWLGQRPQPEN